MNNDVCDEAIMPVGLNLFIMNDCSAGTSRGSANNNYGSITEIATATTQIWGLITKILLAIAT